MSRLREEKYQITDARRVQHPVCGDNVPAVRVYYNDGLFTDLPIDGSDTPADLVSNCQEYELVKIFRGAACLRYRIQRKQT